jgi:hypothetical protein
VKIYILPSKVPLFQAIMIVFCETCGSYIDSINNENTCCYQRFQKLNQLSLQDQFKKLVLTKISNLLPAATIPSQFINEYFESFEYSEILINHIKNSLISFEGINDMIPDFVIRPMKFTATSLSNRESWEFVLTANRAKVNSTNRDESKAIDILFSHNFHVERREIEIGINNNSSTFPVSVAPDGQWEYEGINYIIEVKTCHGFHKQNQFKIDQYRRQIASSQFAWNNDNEKHLLVLIDINVNPYQVIVLKVNESNKDDCFATWNLWFYNFGQFGWRSKIFQWLHQYHNKEITFLDILNHRNSSTQKVHSVSSTNSSSSSNKKVNAFDLLQDDSDGDEDEDD